MINTFEQALVELRAAFDEKDAIIAFYGSRVRSTASLDSDWDVVMLVTRGDAEKRIEFPDLKLDVLTVPMSVTEQDLWTKRELCAVLMSDDVRVVQGTLPRWNVDWDAIIKEKERRVRGVADLYLRKRALIPRWKKLDPVDARDQQLRRIRRWAQRVAWMKEKREIPSTPELDKEWNRLPWGARDEVLRSCGVTHPTLIDDVDTFT